MSGNAAELYKLINANPAKKQDLFRQALQNPQGAIKAICAFGNEMNLPVTSEEVKEYLSNIDDFDTTEIPEDFIFILGDNRKKSLDSRLTGLVEISNFLHKIVPKDHFVYNFKLYIYRTAEINYFQYSFKLFIYFFIIIQSCKYSFIFIQHPLKN